MRTHIVNLVRWYATPVGALFAALVIVGFLFGLIGYLIGSVLCISAALAVVVPYKLARQQNESRSLASRVRELDRRAANIASVAKRDSQKWLATFEEIERLDSDMKRIDGIQDRIGSRVERLADDLTHEVDAIREEAREMHRSNTESMTSLQNAMSEVAILRQSLNQMTSEVSGLRRESTALKTQLADEIRELHGELRHERNERMVGIARSQAATDPQRQPLVILAPPRTGSTWLLDSLRAHPLIFFEPTPRILDILGLTKFNRYPGGLSNLEDAYMDVEVGPGRGARIPDFSIKWTGTEREQAYSVEKIHPLFYDFNTSFFIERLDLARAEGSPVRLIVRLREPEYAIRSILRYKMRNSKWLVEVSMEEVPGHVERSFRSIRDVTREHPVTVSRYEDQIEDPVQEMAYLFAELWSKSSTTKHKELAGEIAAVVDRRRRPISQSFLASEPSEEDPGDSKIDHIVEQARDIIARCVRLNSEIQEAATL